MNKQEIMQLLPHRDNMLLIDEAEVVDGEAAGAKPSPGTSGSSRAISREIPWCPG